MKNNIRYHVLFWLGVYLLWVFVFRNYSFSITKTATVEFCYLVFITAGYYAIVRFIIPRFLVEKKFAWFIIINIGLIAVLALLRAVVALEMNIHIFNSSPKPTFNTLYVKSLLNIFIWVELIVLGKLIIDRVQSQRKLEILEKERVRQELDFLKAQINPHALFNSLNTIYAHIDKNNQTARNILLKFSGLLRYQLYDCAEEKISLEKELDYLRNYISFQQIRKEENLVVDVDIDTKPSCYNIAPLLLMVLIENAFKFVSNFTDRDNKIDIKITTKGNLFVFYIRNTTEHKQALSSHKNSGSGIGIINLKRRLALLYAGKHEIAFNQGADYYESILKLDLV